MSTAKPLAPRLVPRVWGGTRLRALGTPDELGGSDRESRTAPIGEAWFGDANETPGTLLVKLLDVRERLSVQVHPDDRLAARLHGPGAMGKHEAWVILDAAPGAELLLGRSESAAPSDLVDAIRSGSGAEAMLARLQVLPGDVVDVPPGLVHALLPGLFVWEVQQPTERTYRVSDWGRNDPSRPLHLAESAAATDGAARGRIAARLDGDAPGLQSLLSTPRFSIRAVVGPFAGSLRVATGTIATIVETPGAAQPLRRDAAATVDARPCAAWSSFQVSGAPNLVVPGGLAVLLAELA